MSPSPVPSWKGEGETPWMMRQNLYAPYSHPAIIRRDSLNALLLSLLFHSTVIVAIFLAGMTFRPVSADLSPLVVTITSLTEGNQADARAATTGKKEKSAKKEYFNASRSSETIADRRNAERISPSTETVPQRADISESAALEIHDRHASVRDEMTGGTAAEGSGTVPLAPRAGRNGASGAIPQYGSNPLPAYPSLARKMGHEGIVLLAAEILSDGRVGHLAVKKSSGFPALDQSALDAVRRWKFIPAKWMGKAVPAWVDVPVKFRLSES
jgi:TonB family protein